MRDAPSFTTVADALRWCIAHGERVRLFDYGVPMGTGMDARTLADMLTPEERMQKARLIHESSRTGEAIASIYTVHSDSLILRWTVRRTPANTQ